MSEDEEELVGDIIRVFICAKSEAGVEFSRKRLLPRILVTDHSEYDMTDLYQPTDLEDVFRRIQTHSDCEEQDEDRTEHLQIFNEFQAEPSELLPDSYLTYVGSCRSLIGDISHYSQTRVPALDWIEQFDKEIDDAIREAEAVEEKERQQRQREEERIRRLKARSLIRKINKPLTNRRPGRRGRRHSYHNRICQLPLETIKKRLRKYQPDLRSRFSVVTNTQECVDHPISTCEATELLRSEFVRYLQNKLNSANKSQLTLEGKCFETLKKSEKKKEKETSNNLRAEPPCRTADLTEIICVSRKETFSKISFLQLKKQYRLKWSKSRGVLEVKNPIRKKSRSGETADEYEIQNKEDRMNNIKAKQLRIGNKIKNDTRTLMESKAVIHIYLPSRDYQVQHKRNYFHKRSKNVISYYKMIFLTPNHLI